jgi:hypothetical protein
MSAFLWVSVYLLCGLWSTVAFQRHPWDFARSFVRRHWLVSSLGWPVIRLLAATDPANPRYRHGGTVEEWLRSLGRDA